MKVKENKEIKAGKDARIIEYLNFAEYYYNIFLKYRDCDFNFQYLRDTLKKAYEYAGMEFDNSENICSDFNTLEDLYFKVKHIPMYND